MKLDASGEYIDFGTSPVLNMGTSGFTVSFWMNYSGVNNASWDIVIGKKAGGWVDRGWLFRIPENSSKLNFHLADGTGYAERSISITPNQWHYIVGVRNGNTTSVYKDGKLEAIPATNPIYGADMSNSVSLKTGWLAGWSYFFGQIDEVAIYSQPLTLSQIQHLYAQGLIRRAVAFRY